MDKTNYTLKDYKQIRTPFCFFDETGQLNNERDRFFALGMIKCSQPYYLYRKIQTLRDRIHFYDEIKWNKLSPKSLPVLLQILNMFFETPGLKFSCIVLKKDDLDFEKHFRGNLWQAYQSFAVLQLKGNISRNEVLCVLADHVTTPPDVKFEVDVKRKVNEDFKRLAIQGVCRIDSRGADLIQMTDLLLGAIVYDFKVGASLIPLPSKVKAEFLSILKKKLGTKSFTNGFRNRYFNVWVFKTK